MDNELFSYKLTISVDSFYSGWLQHAQDKNRQAYYCKLYCDVSATLDVLGYTFGRLLFAPNLDINESVEYRNRYVSLFLMAFTKFLYDVSLYRPNVKLQDNEIDSGLERFVVALYSLQQQFYSSVGETPGFGIGLYNDSQLYSLLPTLYLYMTEITSFLRPHVVRM